ncbi:MAG: hemerythrin domain-containing protein [Vampirovibrionales bacterium]|nr:hemerythrin domain-containing protein [Vampirovibrionales bacterium]
MTLFTLLKEEHKEAKTTLKQLVEQDELQQKDTEEICQKLLLHMEMEEKFLYPVMEGFEDSEELTEEAELEHAEAKKLIKDLSNEKLDHVECKVKVEMLQLGIEHHVKEEEEELFPKIKENLSKEDIDAIGEKMLAYKEKNQGKKRTVAAAR